MDLWAKTDQHDDESQTAAGASENGLTTTLRRTRRLTDSAVLSLLRNWLLHDYATAYCRSLAATRIFKRCYWVDGLGIEGRRASRNGMPGDSDPIISAASSAQSSSAPQAPVRTKARKKGAAGAVPPILQPIVTLSEVLAQGDRPINLRGYVMESAGSRHGKRALTREQGQELAPVQKALALPAEGGLVSASWLEIYPTLLKEIEQSPAIFLLNPLGAPPFSYDDLAPLYQRTVPTELCLLIPHKQIESRLPAAHKNSMQANALTALLRSNRWKTLPLEEEKRSEAIAGFLDLFLAAMQRHFQLPPQRIVLPAPSGPASIAPLPYTLIYATRRADSLLIMNDALCHYRRRTYQQSYQGVLGEEWFARQEQERHSMELQSLIHRVQQQGVASRARRWPDLRQQLLLANFGQFTQDEYDTIILQLIAKNEVRSLRRAGGSAAGESIVPGNDDTLQWT